MEFFEHAVFELADAGAGDAELVGDLLVGEVVVVAGEDEGADALGLVGEVSLADGVGLGGDAGLVGLGGAFAEDDVGFFVEVGAGGGSVPEAGRSRPSLRVSADAAVACDGREAGSEGGHAVVAEVGGVIERDQEEVVDGVGEAVEVPDRWHGVHRSTVDCKYLPGDGSVVLPVGPRRIRRPPSRVGRGLGSVGRARICLGLGGQLVGVRLQVIVSRRQERTGACRGRSEGGSDERGAASGRVGCLLMGS